AGERETVADGTDTIVGVGKREPDAPTARRRAVLVAASRARLSCERRNRADLDLVTAPRWQKGQRHPVVGRTRREYGIVSPDGHHVTRSRERPRRGAERRREDPIRRRNDVARRTSVRRQQNEERDDRRDAHRRYFVKTAPFFVRLA